MKLKYTVRLAQKSDIVHAQSISFHLHKKSNNPESGICKRPKDYIEQRILENKAVIAVTETNKWAGFCFIETYDDGLVRSSDLIIHPMFGRGNILKQIQEFANNFNPEKSPR